MVEGGPSSDPHQSRVVALERVVAEQRDRIDVLENQMRALMEHLSGTAVDGVQPTGAVPVVKPSAMKPSPSLCTSVGGHALTSSLQLLTGAVEQQLRASEERANGYVTSSPKSWPNGLMAQVGAAPAEARSGATVEIAGAPQAPRRPRSEERPVRRCAMDPARRRAPSPDDRAVRGHISPPLGSVPPIIMDADHEAAADAPSTSGLLMRPPSAVASDPGGGAEGGAGATERQTTPPASQRQTTPPLPERHVPPSTPASIVADGGFLSGSAVVAGFGGSVGSPHTPPPHRTSCSRESAREAGRTQSPRGSTGALRSQLKRHSSLRGRRPSSPAPTRLVPALDRVALLEGPHERPVQAPTHFIRMCTLH